VPGVLDMLDYYHRALAGAAARARAAAGAVSAESRFGAGLNLDKTPSEYFEQNFFLGASFMRPTRCRCATGSAWRS